MTSIHQTKVFSQPCLIERTQSFLSLHDIAQISSVSKSWNSIWNPWIWRRPVFLVTTRKYEPEGLVAGLERYGYMVQELNILNTEVLKSKDILNAVHQYCTRLRYLCFNTHQDSCISECLLSKPLPNLRIINIEYTYSLNIIKTILEGLKGSNLPLLEELRYGPTLPIHLRVINFYIKISEVARILNDFPNLKILELKGITFPNLDDKTLKEAFESISNNNNNNNNSNINNNSDNNNNGNNNNDNDDNDNNDKEKVNQEQDQNQTLTKEQQHQQQQQLHQHQHQQQNVEPYTRHWYKKNKRPAISVKLWKCYADEAGLQMFLQHIPKLKHFQFDIQNQKSYNFLNIMAKYHPRIRELSVPTHYISGLQDDLPISPWFQFKSLTSLNIRQVQVTNTGLRVISEQQGHRLEKLALGKISKANHQGLEYILNNCTKLKELELKDIQTKFPISKFDWNCRSTLEKLDIRGTKLFNSRTKFVGRCRFFNQFPNLVGLGVDASKIRCGKVFEPLGNNNQIKYLYLGSFGYISYNPSFEDLVRSHRQLEFVHVDYISETAVRKLESYNIEVSNMARLDPLRRERLVQFGNYSTN